MLLMAKARRWVPLIAVVAALGASWPVLTFTHLGFTGRGDVRIPLLNLLGAGAGLLIGSIATPVAADAERLDRHRLGFRVLALTVGGLAAAAVCVAAATQASLWLGASPDQLGIVRQLRSLIVFAGLGHVCAGLLGKGSSWIGLLIFLGWLIYFGCDERGRAMLWNPIAAPDAEPVVWVFAAASYAVGIVSILAWPSLSLAQILRESR